MRPHRARYGLPGLASGPRRPASRNLPNRRPQTPNGVSPVNSRYQSGWTLTRSYRSPPEVAVVSSDIDDDSAVPDAGEYHRDTAWLLEKPGHRRPSGAVSQAGSRGRNMTTSTFSRYRLLPHSSFGSAAMTMLEARGRYGRRDALLPFPRTFRSTPAPFRCRSSPLALRCGWVSAAASMGQFP